MAQKKPLPPAACRGGPQAAADELYSSSFLGARPTSLAGGIMSPGKRLLLGGLLANQFLGFHDEECRGLLQPIASGQPSRRIAIV